MLKQIKKKVIGKLTAQPKHTQSHLGLPETPYEEMGEDKVRALAKAFYDNMETNPDVAELLAIHPLPLDNVRQKFFEFLSGWLGGPDLFVEKYGHPRLRARHLPFQVNETMYRQWMICMQAALDEVLSDDPVLKADLRVKFDQLARHMINC